MLYWMCGKSRQCMVTDNNNREIGRVTHIVEKMVEIRIRWFEHVERRFLDYVVRKLQQMEGSQIT